MVVKQNEIRCVPTIWHALHSGSDVSLFHSACTQESVLVMWFWQLTRWVHDAKYSTRHVWSVLPQRREWFAEPHVGFLSNFQQFLLWLCAIHWCKLIQSQQKSFTVWRISVNVTCVGRSENANAEQSSFKNSPEEQSESNYSQTHTPNWFIYYTWLQYRAPKHRLLVYLTLQLRYN